MAIEELSTGVTCHTRSAKDATVSFWGDVDDVIAGRFDPAIWKEEISATSFRYAFELGACRDVRVTNEGEEIDNQKCGECVCAFGTCYTRGCDRSSELYYQTHWGTSMKTTGLAMVGPHDAECNFEVEISSEIEYETLIRMISEKLQHQPFTFGGLLKWDSVNVTACALPPINGENIFENKDKFYPPDLAGPHTRVNKVTVIHGFVAPMQKLEGSEIYKPLRRVLYAKPAFMQLDKEEAIEGGKQVELTLHAHLITTDDSKSDITRIKNTAKLGVDILPSDPTKEEISHLNGGVISSGRLEIFVIKTMNEHTEFM